MEFTENSRLLTNKHLKTIIWSVARLYPPIKIGIIEQFLYTMMIYVALQTILLMKANWTVWDFGKKVTSVENLNLTLLILLHLTELYLMQDTVLISLHLIDSNYFTEDQQNDETNFTEMISVAEEKFIEIIKASRFIFLCFYFGYCYISVFGIIAYLFKYKSIEELDLPFQVYFPIPVSRSIYLYISIAFCQWLYIFFCYNMSMIIFSNTILALEHVRIEMEIFKVRLEKFKIFDRAVKAQLKGSGIIDLPELKKFEVLSRLLVEHHQTVFSKVRQLIKGLKFRIFYVNFFICAQICFTIFCVEAGDTIYKIKYGFLTISLLIAEGIFSETGQRILDEADDIRRLLFELFSTEHPHWFHRNLLIMMIQNNNMPNLGFLNLFTLNRNNIAAVVQAAYSYFNLLNQRKIYQ